LPTENSIPAPASLGLRVLHTAMVVAAALLFSLHYWHLRADFPNDSPWSDWSKYTDEGWYGDAAIRHFQLGHWYVPGDFNPAAALPVWPIVEGLLFRITGVSLSAARALSVSVFGCILIASYLLIRRWRPRAKGEPTRQNLSPALAVLLLSVSPFCFVFTRLAILEPMLVLLTLLALHAATSAPKALAHSNWFKRFLPTVLLGILLPLMILTKTTGLFLMPAIAFLLWSASGRRMGPCLRSGIPAAAIGLLAWSAYFFAVVRPHYLPDYRYLFSANAYTGITLGTAMSVLWDTFTSGLWIGRILYPLAVVALVVALVRVRTLRSQPLIPTLIVWSLGYAAFLAYHDNLQPRYYLVIAVPLTLLVAVVFEPAWHMLRPVFHATHSTPARPMIALATMAALALVVADDARQTIDYVRNPEFTLVDAAHSLAEVVRASPAQNPLVLSISGSDLSLMTGLPSICDDFGTLDLARRVEKYKPGWYAAWNDLEDDKMDALDRFYTPVRVATFPAMDDPDRNLLILYRLDPRQPSGPTPKRTRKPIPRSLQTKLGQQPSVQQLEH
jgi:hypothetical protein